ncbi:DUF1273 domain-containing protein [Loigolactobacillus zhaoyuanensis]|uniref:UPF0398 protein ACEN34_04865 n=1 Tax=Loigolactobacillus zhaoyuanensis TaxID=2486017 RepID=A0ABW8UFF7_9LACO|nr:DUF1273 domain-containing protein [Loigolactobacillus zhaoyuanensis]
MRLWVTGYRSYELGVFSANEPKLKIIKAALQAELIAQFDQGLDWVISGGQLGTEQWSLEVATTLKKDYPELQTALMLPFADFGKNWNEANQTALVALQGQVDFSAAVSDKPYHSPKQLRNYQEFMLKHTDGALVLYDDTAPGKTHFTVDAIRRYQQKHDYALSLIDFDNLQDTANNYQEEQENGFQAD